MKKLKERFHELFGGPPAATQDKSQPNVPGGKAEPADSQRGQAGETVIDFHEVDASQVVEGIDAGPYLARFGISISRQKEGTDVRIFNARLSMRASARASSSPNILTQVYHAQAWPTSYTLDFRAPLEAIRFTRATILADVSGIVYPSWKATALNSHGKELSSVGEPFGGSFDDIPAKEFTLNGPGIKSVEFLADGRDGRGTPRAGIVSVLIDDLTLVNVGKPDSPDQGVPETNAATARIDDPTVMDAGKPYRPGQGVPGETATAAPIAHPTQVNARAPNTPELAVQTGHSDRIRSVAYSPDGSILASAGADHTIQLWQVATGYQIRTLRGHTDRVNSICFGPDDMLASASDDGAARLWNIKTGAGTVIFKGRSGVASAVVSPDGGTLATGSYGDGGNERTIRLWDRATGTERLSPRFDYREWASALAFSPKGDKLLSGSHGDQTIRLWNVSTGAEIWDSPYRALGGVLTTVAFSQDGNIVAGGGARGMLYLLDAESGRNRVAPIRTDTGNVESITFAPPDGKMLAIASNESMRSTLKFWGPGGGEVRFGFSAMAEDGSTAAFEPPKSLFGLSFNCAGTELAFAGDDNAVYLMDMRTHVVRKLEGRVQPIMVAACSDSGETLAVASLETAPYSDESQRRPIVIWSLAAGRKTHTLLGHSHDITSLAFGPRPAGQPGETNQDSPGLDDTILASSSVDDTIRVWNTSTGGQLGVVKGGQDGMACVAISPDGMLIAGGGRNGSIKLWKVSKRSEGFTFEDARPFQGNGLAQVRRLAFSPDGKTLASGGSDGTIKLWKVDDGREQLTLEGAHSLAIGSLAFKPGDGNVLVSASDDRTIKVWNLQTCGNSKPCKGITLEEHAVPFKMLAFSPDGKLLASGSDDQTPEVWDTVSWKLKRRLEGQGGRTISVSFVSNEVLASASEDSQVKLWAVPGGTTRGVVSPAPDGPRELCSLISFRDDSWTVVDPEGRFDTSSLEENPGLHWVMPDDLTKALPLEIFMRDYDEPRLLSRILGGEKLPEVRDLSSLNRVQPIVEVLNIEQQEDSPELATVSVRVAGARSERQRDKNGKPLETGVYDLRLFRDGQIVAQANSDNEPLMASHGPLKPGGRDEIQSWREENRVTLGPDGTKTLSFRDIKLPRMEGIDKVTFSAYAFNEDRVKSETAKRGFAIPKELEPVKGRAYVIAFGANAYESESWDLMFAAADARLTLATLDKSLRRTGRYEEVIKVPLISDYTHVDRRRVLRGKSATKGNFKAVLDLLAGRRPDPGANIDGAIPGKICPASPEDLVIISFAGHGHSDGRGNFYLFPYDIGENVTTVTDETLRRCISSEELSAWLRNVDAGDMVMIVDACHSAATVDAAGFKPGPMGSRGLGQLAYDKGMRILAASQADDVALESDRIKHGLLTYALVCEGLEDSKADKNKDGIITLEEWLAYGAERVPTLFRELSREQARSSGAGPEQPGKGREVRHQRRSGRDAKLVTTDGGQSLKKPAQRPSLFDFVRRKAAPVVVAIRGT
jgi:WD40 repeat protein